MAPSVRDNISTSSDESGKLGWGCFVGLQGAGYGLRWASNREMRKEKLQKDRRNVGDGLEYSTLQVSHMLLDLEYGMSIAFFWGDLQEIRTSRKLGTKTLNVPKPRYCFFRRIGGQCSTQIFNVFGTNIITYDTHLISGSGIHTLDLFSKGAPFG